MPRQNSPLFRLQTESEGSPVNYVAGNPDPRETSFQKLLEFIGQISSGNLVTASLQKEWAALINVPLFPTNVQTTLFAERKDILVGQAHDLERWLSSLDINNIINFLIYGGVISQTGSFFSPNDIEDGNQKTIKDGSAITFDSRDLKDGIRPRGTGIMALAGRQWFVYMNNRDISLRSSGYSAALDGLKNYARINLIQPRIDSFDQTGGLYVTDTVLIKSICGSLIRANSERNLSLRDGVPPVFDITFEELKAY